jgi:hypothetical protein
MYIYIYTFLSSPTPFSYPMPLLSLKKGIHTERKEKNSSDAGREGRE